MTTIKNLPSVQRLQSILLYDGERLIWRRRPDTDARNRRFNTIFAGKYAGGLAVKGYLRLRVDGVLYFVHRIIWKLVHGSEPPHEIDHRNGLKLDNRIENLRLASKAENCQNKHRPPDNTSGVKGVNFHKGKWRAYISHNRTRYWLGRYATKAQAAAAYRAAAIKYHGEFTHPEVLDSLQNLAGPVAGVPVSE